jgi:protein tyrosine phosphatase type 4A
VRVCEPTYKIDELKAEGIVVTDLAYDDGTSPANEVNYSIKYYFAH